MNKFQKKLNSIFNNENIFFERNFVSLIDASSHINQEQTNQIFTEKWNKYDNSDNKKNLFEFQKNWYLKLYGFNNEHELAIYLQQCEVILDAGCGLGYKADWFAQLAPNSLIIGMDFSGSAKQASINYSFRENLFFIQSDIAKTGLKEETIDYVSCDQVIMHTENPDDTFAELCRITKNQGQVACYFYAQKALPRELLDDHFRTKCLQMSKEELWELSKQVTELGRTLSNLNIEITVPEIKALNINAGKYDIQRFIYWNFLKCFWNEQLGEDTSIITNFDWYSPSNAKRYNELEINEYLMKNDLIKLYFHKEEACFSGRFRKCN